MSRLVSLARHIAALPPLHATHMKRMASSVRPCFIRTMTSGQVVQDPTQGFDPRTFYEAASSRGEEGIARLRRSLLYRSRQTGWLETDLIMGRWAAENLENLGVEDLHLYSSLCKEEILDIFQWITKQSPTPAKHDNKVMAMLQEYAVLNPPAGAKPHVRT